MLNELVEELCIIYIMYTFKIKIDVFSFDELDLYRERFVLTDLAVNFINHYSGRYNNILE